MYSFLANYFKELLFLVNEMSAYLLFGFLIAGLLHVLIKKDSIKKYIGQDSIKSIIYATLIGIPLPLCSCGVIPTGISFYKQGASTSATISFLTATPQTGVDSIMITYSLLGLPFAIIRPIVALFSGILGGVLNIYFNKKEIVKKEIPKNTKPQFFLDTTIINKSKSCKEGNCSCPKETKNQSVYFRALKFAFIDVMDDIAKWLFIGILLAALFSVVIPNDFFNQLNNSYLEIFFVLILSVPIYMCATGSIPIAAILLLKGLSPGAALVLLVAGPATNITSLTVLGKTIGRKATIIFLASIVLSSVFFGLLINISLPSEWFSISNLHSEHKHELLPDSIKYISSIILFILVFYSLIKKIKFR
ncbi:MAG: SO_0444 family Cu/Zn efflux transporter [Bacteroidales bacterium]|nr:SO_0444 family Cu/Zn efflux transporter [Bacteroidales bacterium]